MGHLETPNQDNIIYMGVLCAIAAIQMISFIEIS